MTVIYATMGAMGFATGGFLLGVRYTGSKLARILSKLSDAQLAKLADQVQEERKRGLIG